MKHMSDGLLSLTFLIYPCKEKQGRYVAHCLELDVVAVEDTKPKVVELLKELISDLISAAVEDDTIERILNPAPPESWNRLATAKPYYPPQKVVEHHIAAKLVKRVDYVLAAA